jgi:hypothetical protein
MNFSILLASRERVPLLTKFLQSLKENTKYIGAIEVLIGIDHDDKETCLSEEDLVIRFPFVRFFRRHRSKFLNKDYLNWLFQFSHGKYVMACNDDVEVKTKDWDEIAINTLEKYLSDKVDGIVYGYVEDGLNDRHGMGYCCFPLFSRRAIQAVGWVLPPVFRSWNADIAAWRVYSSIERICAIPVLFDHISYHTGKRSRDQISIQMERLDQEGGITGNGYDISEDVIKLFIAIGQTKKLPEGKNGIIFSILVPTRERPEQLEAFIESVSNTAFNRSIVEILVAYDNDDKKTHLYIQKLNRRFGSLVKFYSKQRSNMLNRDYFNWLQRFSNGTFLITCHDDCRFLTQSWDQILANKLKGYLSNKVDYIVYANSAFPVISRNAVEILGYTVHPDFPSWGAGRYLERLFQSLNRLMPLSEIVIDHISYHTGKREKDVVNLYVERCAARVPGNPEHMNIFGDREKLNNHILEINEEEKPPIIKPHLLFVTEKWCDGNPHAGATNSHHNLFGSLQVSNVATYDCLHIDECHLQGVNIDSELLKTCKEKRPDAIISTYLCHPAHLNVSTNTWAEIQRMGIPIVFIWFDISLPFVAAIADSLAGYSAVSVALDTSNINNDKFISMWTPQDTRYYYNSHAPRDIDICFLGSMHGYHERNSCIAALKYNGIEVVQLGGQREQPLPLEAYASILQRAKVCLSFPQYRNIPHLFQAKGRIFEITLCGALLMDMDNPQTKHWFKPDEEYISFKDERDLVEKARKYIADDSLRGEIATNGWTKASLAYSAENFWKTVLKKAGVL